MQVSVYGLLCVFKIQRFMFVCHDAILLEVW